MLVLSRKQNQKIHVGNDITITILKIRGNSVRIGIEAPKSVPVMRGELETQEQSVPPEDNFTVEFRSNAVNSETARPELRLVNDTETTHGAAANGNSPGRLQQMVALASEQRRVQ